VAKALSANPDSSYGHVLMGNLFWSKQNLVEADRHLKMAAELAPWRSPARIQYANFKLQTKHAEGAKAYLAQITKHASDYLVSIRNRPE